jgi:hypothetical protein
MKPVANYNALDIPQSDKNRYLYRHIGLYCTSSTSEGSGFIAQQIDKFEKLSKIK